MFDVLHCMDVLNMFYTLPAFLRDRAAEFFEILEDNVKNDYKLHCDYFKDRFLPKELKGVGTLSPIFGPNFRFYDTITSCCKNAV